MKIFLTFDYEIFFGHRSGSIHNCLLKPTNSLLDLFSKYNVKVTFYVDAGMLLRLRKNDQSKLEYLSVIEQLEQIHSLGHDIQLHIHPHWDDASFVRGQWFFSPRSYRLHQFRKNELRRIVYSYSKELTKITSSRPIAFRAGGWCIQPFSYLMKELYESGIKVDSTVFYGGKRISKIYGFDFSNAPEKTKWRFDDDPVEQRQYGRFYELPISSIKVSPFYYYKILLFKNLYINNQRPYGDGVAIPLTYKQKIRFLVWSSYMAVSSDGYKCKLLPLAAKKHIISHGINSEFVVIGHPKAISPYSLQNLKKFIQKSSADSEFVTTSQWYKRVTVMDI